MVPEFSTFKIIPVEKFLNVTNLKKLKCFDFALNNIEKIENLEGSILCF